MSSVAFVRDAAPADALALARDRLPYKPYCTDSLAAGVYVRPVQAALKKAYIQLDPPGRVSVLVFDVDRAGAVLSWDDAGLPPPSWTSMSPDSGRAHVAYVLETSVWPEHSAKAARYAEAVYRAYSDRLRADPGYARLITKSPWSSNWRLTCWRKEPYDLAELAEYVDLGRHAVRLPRRHTESLGLGRNSDMFESLRQWAYTSIPQYWRPDGYDAWHAAVLDECERRAAVVCLEHAKGPLPWSEIRATAKSVASWTWKHMSPAGRADLIARTHTSEAQARRGIKSGEARRKGTALERDRSPWESMGISRATWYRRQRMPGASEGGA